MQGVVDEDADGATPSGRDATDHFLGLMVEGLGQESMHGPRIGTTLGLLVLELVHLTEDLHRNEDMIILKAVEAIRIVKQDIRIEDKILDRAGGTFAFYFTDGPAGWNYWKEDALFFGGFQWCCTVHGVCFYVDGGWINGKRV